MKTLIILLTISIPTLCFSQWNGIYFHGDQETSISVINQDHIVAVTDDGGRIHRSTDGGQTWSFFQTMFTGSYFDVDFPTDLIGYACGGSAFGDYGDFIAKTVDGGQTWDSLTASGPGSYFTRIQFLNADTGFVTPMNGQLYKTTNGGMTFDTLPLIDPQMLAVNDIAIKPNGEIFVCLRLTQGPGLTSYIAYRSIDLGASWTEVIACNESIGKIFFVNNTIGYAVGADGAFLKTTDGGTTWTCSYINPFTHLSAIHFTSENVGYINNAGGIYRTEDGGMSWTVQNISPLTIIHQIKFANDTIGFAVGEMGIYKTTNGGEILSVEEITNKSDFTLYPNPTTNKIFITPFDETVQSVVIYNQQGQKVKELKAKSELDVSSLPKGIYLLEIKTDKSQMIKRFVKE